MDKQYDRAALTEADVCNNCGKDLRLLDEIHVVEGLPYCSKDCAVEHQANIITSSALNTAKEWYRDCAEIVTPRDIGMVSEIIYTHHIKENDITIIFKALHGEDDKYICTDVIGMYRGEPNEQDTELFKGVFRAMR